MKKTLATAVIAAGVLVGSVGTASASHPHFIQREDRDGVTHCQYIAEGQTSKEHDSAGDPTEPGGGEFHSNVHKGQPGNDDKGTDFGRDTEESAMCEETHENGLR